MGVTPGFQPAQIDQSLLQQGMQTAMAQAQGQGRQVTPGEMIDQLKAMQARANPQAASPTNPANTTPASPAAMVQNPFADVVRDPLGGMGAFNNAMNSAFGRPAPRGLLEVAPNTPAASAPMGGSQSDRRRMQALQLLGLLR